MIRKRPKGDPRNTKATYDHKRPRYDPPCPARLEADIALVAAECAHQRASHKDVTAAGGLGNWAVIRMGLPPEPPKPAFKRRF
jgi:hypothetical protein